MPFMELLSNALSLNTGWFADLAADNIEWAFIFYAAGHYFTDGKMPLFRGLVFFALVWTSMDIFRLTGFSVFTAAGIAMLYFLRMPVLLFLEKSGGLAKYIPLGWAVTFYVVIIALAFGG